ncbi:glutathione transferase gst 23 [Quercus suber]|uniref:Glutathione transferase gst 23 n=1 Tax=Quercus suber TaxID=58331 RepID=A0AAW0JAH9_QUESU
MSLYKSEKGGGVLPSIWNAFIKQGKDQEEAIVTAQENLGFVERQLTGKKFFNGETIGLVDLAFGWLANLLSVLEENFADAPIIKESWPPRDKLISKYRALREVYTSKEAPK